MSEPLWHKLREVFRRSTGMILPEAVRSRSIALIERLARQAGTSAPSYLDVLDDDREARQVLLDELGLGTTWFMRDAAGLRALVAALRTQARRDRAVHIWSVGCSTGEEPYSLAMALTDAGMSARILATDLNRAALERARRGQYRPDAMHKLPQAWRSRYFQAEGDDRIRLVAALRQLVTFELHNLQDRSEPPPGWPSFDAIICRNVLIYFEREQAIEIIRRLAGYCQPAGYLLLGAIERPLCWMAGNMRFSDDSDLVHLGTSPARPARASQASPVRPSNADERAFSPEPDSRLDDDRLLARAEDAERHKDMSEALALMDRVINRSPLDAAAHLQRGRMYKKQGDTERAIVDLRAARCLDRDGWLAPYLLALCLEEMGEPDEALEAYRYALGVIESGGGSGYYRVDRDIEGMATMTADACIGRIRKLAG